MAPQVSNSPVELNTTRIPADSQSQSTPETTSKVQKFIISAKEKLFNVLTPISSYSKNKISVFYEDKAPAVKAFLSDNKCILISAIATIALAYCFPILAVVGAGIGFATYQLMPEATSSLFTTNNTILLASGAIGLILPPCSISAIAILGGTIGIGRAINHMAAKLFKPTPNIA